MSFNKIFLDKDTFIDMYHSGKINRALTSDAIICTDTKSQKYLELYENDKLNDLKKLILKDVKKNN